MLQLFFTAKSNVTGARAAIQTGGEDACTGFGTDVMREKFQYSPSWL